MYILCSHFLEYAFGVIQSDDLVKLWHLFITCWFGRTVLHIMWSLANSQRLINNDKNQKWKMLFIEDFNNKNATDQGKALDPNLLRRDKLTMTWTSHHDDAPRMCTAWSSHQSAAGSRYRTPLVHPSHPGSTHPTLQWENIHNFKANIKAISSNIYQLQLIIKLHHFKPEIFNSV